MLVCFNNVGVMMYRIPCWWPNRMCRCMKSSLPCKGNWRLQKKTMFAYESNGEKRFRFAWVSYSRIHVCMYVCMYVGKVEYMMYKCMLGSVVFMYLCLYYMYVCMYYYQCMCMHSVNKRWMQLCKPYRCTACEWWRSCPCS